MVALQFLVLSVLVRIRVGQQKREAIASLFYFTKSLLKKSNELLTQAKQKHAISHENIYIYYR